MENKLSFDNVLAFLLAGKAIFTLQNARTQVRFTYRIKKLDSDEKNLWFVSVLTGPQNESDYSFLGCIWDGQTFTHGKKSRIGKDAPSAQAFAWFFGHLVRGSQFPEALGVYHSGRCGRCGRTLTTPESIETGIGPVCAEMM